MAQNKYTPIKTLECCECSWIGRESELKQTENEEYRKSNLNVLDNRCPKCGSTKLYDIHHYYSR